jgi:hypothetical protein
MLIAAHGALRYEANMCEFGHAVQQFSCVTVAEAQERIVSLVPAAANMSAMDTVRHFHMTLCYFGGHVDPAAFSQLIFFMKSAQEDHGGRRVAGGALRIHATAVVFDTKAVALSISLDGDDGDAEQTSERAAAVAYHNVGLRALSQNAHAHVTLATARGVPAVYSNEMLRSPGATRIPLNDVWLRGAYEFQ